MSFENQAHGVNETCCLTFGHLQQVVIALHRYLKGVNLSGAVVEFLGNGVEAI